MRAADLARVAHGVIASTFVVCAAHAGAASPAGDTVIRVEPEYQLYTKSSAQPKVARADPSTIHAVRLEAVAANALEKSARATGPGVPLQVGFARDVSELSDAIHTISTITWRTLQGGQAVGALSVTSPSAASLRAGLRVKAIPAGALVRFYAPGSSEVYEVSAEDIQENVGRIVKAGELQESSLLYWSPAIEGDTVVVEIELPVGETPSHLDLAVPSVSHLVTSPAREFAMPVTKAGSASCENDVMCYQNDWGNESNSVARILFVDGGSSFLCSGTLLNDLDTSTQIPYFLTANHCINSQAAASSIQSRWFYRASACNSGVAGTSVNLAGGATLLYNSATTDTSLVRFAGTPPGGAMYAGWSVGTALGSGASVTGIHHPGGDLQKISFGNIAGFETCSPAVNESFSCNRSTASASTFLAVNWTSGLTEPGSSGSGLFLNNGHYLVGQLYGGSGSTCTSAGAVASGTDSYGRFDVAYNAGLYTYLGGTPSSTTGGGTSGSGTTGAPPPPSTATPTLNYTALWWNPTESGWGLSINQHGSTLFAAWYEYSSSGNPRWIVMPGGSWSTPTTVTGTLYQTSGPASTQPYNASQVVATAVGTATINFIAADRAVLTYNVNGVSGTKAIQAQNFGTPASTAVTQYNDLWWNSTESGWGVSIAQQGTTLFSVVYTYGQFGQPQWYVMPGGTWNGTTYSGPLYATTAAPGDFFGGAFDASAVGVTPVGTMSIAFSGNANATLSYTVNGQVFNKAIARQAF